MINFYKDKMIRDKLIIMFDVYRKNENFIRFSNDIRLKMWNKKDN